MGALCDCSNHSVYEVSDILKRAVVNCHLCAENGIKYESSEGVASDLNHQIMSLDPHKYFLRIVLTDACL